MMVRETYQFQQNFAGAAAIVNRTLVTASFNSQRWLASVRFTSIVETAGGIFNRYPVTLLLVVPASGPLYMPSNQNFALLGGSTDLNGELRYYQGPINPQFKKYNYVPGEIEFRPGVVHTFSYVTLEAIAAGETIRVFAELGFWLPSPNGP